MNNATIVLYINKIFKIALLFESGDLDLKSKGWIRSHTSFVIIEFIFISIVMERNWNKLMSTTKNGNHNVD